MSEVANDAARLIVITDHQRWSEAHTAQRVVAICEGAAPHSVVVQLRDRDLDAVERLRLGARLRQITMQHQQRFIVSERVDLAVLLRADGVALPEASFSAEDAYSLLRSKGVVNPWISVAWHDTTRLPDGAATVCVLSPIAEARKGRPGLGFDQLTQLRSRLPAIQGLFALGGIDANNAVDCLKAGAQGVAVMGAAFDEEPLALLRALGIAVTHR